MSGLVKPKKINIADTNIANLGTALEKEVKLAAAKTEPAWAVAGKAVGLQIWRIEKFNVVAWPKDQYGQFYTGDSYIVLNTYKKAGQDKIFWDVHFWLGLETTQDEAGTAAYKTVELDDILGGEPVQHREVQGYESNLFGSYFNGKITILAGGVASGFRHVKPEEYKPRLMHIKGTLKNTRVSQVDLEIASLNQGDVFILDLGLTIYVFNGSKASPGERSKGGSLARAIVDERAGKPQLHILSEDDAGDEFWTHFGGKAPLKSAEDGGADNAAATFEKKLLRLSEAAGKFDFSVVATGSAIKRSQLDSSDVFIFDIGSEVFAWIGRGASVGERQKSMTYAQEYLTKASRPAHLSISRILEGGENEVFESSF